MKPQLKSINFALLAGTLAGILCPLQSYAASYTFQTLNNPADPTFNQLLGINNAGTIGGYFGVGSQQNPNKGYTLAPPYLPNSSYTNENFPGSTQTQVVGINNLSSPTTVGFFADAAGNNTGFVDKGGVFTPVTNPNTPANGSTVVNQLLGVNDKGAAVGFYFNAQGDAAAYEYQIKTGTFRPIVLPTSFNAVMTTATGINDAGLISGFYVDNNGDTHGFLNSRGSFISYNDPSALNNTSFFGLNNNGEVVGSYQDVNGVTHGFTFNLATKNWQTVDDPNASGSPAFDITGTTINGVNDQGQLVGFYSDGTNVDGFLATPTTTPEPASIGIAGLGLLALAWGVKRKRSRAA